MARELRSIVKLSRREGYALHPKAHKVLVRRTNKPGEQNNNRRMNNKASQYALQLREKQKVKRLYGLLERQFAKLMSEASRQRGQSGTVLLEMLERRLDNTVYRAGLGSSRPASRQLVTHGHFLLNGRRIDIPSIRVKIGDKILVRPASQKSEYFKNLENLSPAPGNYPAWLKVDRQKLAIEVTGIPGRDDAEPDIKEQLIVEHYSR